MEPTSSSRSSSGVYLSLGVGAALLCSALALAIIFRRELHIADFSKKVGYIILRERLKAQLPLGLAAGLSALALIVWGCMPKKHEGLQLLEGKKKLGD